MEGGEHEKGAMFGGFKCLPAWHNMSNRGNSLPDAHTPPRGNLGSDGALTMKRTARMQIEMAPPAREIAVIDEADLRPLIAADAHIGVDSKALVAGTRCGEAATEGPLMPLHCQA